MLIRNCAPTCSCASDLLLSSCFPSRRAAISSFVWDKNILPAGPPRREVKNKNHTRKRGREEGGMEDGDTTHSQKRCLVSWCSAMVLVRRGKQTVALHTVEART